MTSPRIGPRLRREVPSDVIIYLRDIRLDIVIPEKYVWEFMKEFGNIFAMRRSDGGREIKSVEGYFEHPNGWHIQVCVGENDEDRFRAFLQAFSVQRGLGVDLRPVWERYAGGDPDS